MYLRYKNGEADLASISWTRLKYFAVGFEWYPRLCMCEVCVKNHGIILVSCGIFRLPCAAIRTCNAVMHMPNNLWMFTSERKYAYV